MTPFEQAIEIAAEALWVDREGKWEGLPGIIQHQTREAVLPVVQALQDAGLLVGEQP